MRAGAIIFSEKTPFILEEIGNKVRISPKRTLYPDIFNYKSIFYQSLKKREKKSKTNDDETKKLYFCSPKKEGMAP